MRPVVLLIKFDGLPEILLGQIIIRFDYKGAVLVDLSPPGHQFPQVVMSLSQTVINIYGHLVVLPGQLVVVGVNHQTGQAVVGLRIVLVNFSGFGQMILGLTIFFQFLQEQC